MTAGSPGRAGRRPKATDVARYVLGISRTLAMLVVSGACAVFVLAGGPAVAAGEAVTGRLVDDGHPVVGVEVVVAGDGTEIGSASLPDGTGEFRVPVPGPGGYQVTLAVETLPDGVVLADPERQTLPRVEVQPGADKIVVFAFERGAGPPAPTDTERFVALLLSGLRFGLVVAVAAVGLNLAYSTTGVPNLAHGELITFGALVVWYVNDAGVPLPVAGALAVLAGVGLGRVLDTTLWRPLRRRGTDRITVMVITIGLALFLRHVYLLLFWGGQCPLADAAIQAPWRFGPIELLPKSAATIVIAVVLLVATATFLTQTLSRHGRSGDRRRRRPRPSQRHRRRSHHPPDVDGLRRPCGGGRRAPRGHRRRAVGPRPPADPPGLRRRRRRRPGPRLRRDGRPGCSSASPLRSALYWIASDYKLLVALALLVLTLLVRPQGILGQRERVG